MAFEGRDARGREHYRCLVCGQPSPRVAPAPTDPNVVHLDDDTYDRLLFRARDSGLSLQQFVLSALEEFSQLSEAVQQSLIRDYWDANRPHAGWLAALRQDQGL